MKILEHRETTVVALVGEVTRRAVFQTERMNVWFGQLDPVVCHLTGVWNNKMRWVPRPGA